MRFGRLRVLDLLFLVAVLAGCSAPDAPPRAVRADVAVPSYAPPSGAPRACATLARTTHLTGLPVAVGTLTTQPEDVGAKLDLTAAIDELRDVLSEVTDGPALGPLRTSLEHLVAALREARDAPLTDAVRTQIRTGLDDVGLRAQALCGFPT